MPWAVRRHLPNAMTVLRLFLAGAFFASLNSYRYPDQNRLWANVAIGLFIAAVLTDFLDGFLARRWQAVTTFGRLMDPFCDKVLILGAFIYMAGPRFVVAAWVEDGSFFTMATGVYPWMVAVILARELLVTGIRGLVESMGVRFGARWSGKWKMILQSVSIPIVLALTVNYQTHQTEWARWACYVLVYLTVGVTLWSGLPYVFELRAVMARARAPQETDGP